jgi:hypothetical protein
MSDQWPKRGSMSLQKATVSNRWGGVTALKVLVAELVELRDSKREGVK